MESIAYRHFHSMVSIPINTGRVLVIVFGGVREWQWGKSASQQPALTGCAIIEAGKQKHKLMMDLLACSAL